MKHEFYKCDKYCDGCNFCQGGLKSCTVCKGAECSLTVDCPGVPISSKEQDDICAGKYDYINGEWVQLLITPRPPVEGPDN